VFLGPLPDKIKESHESPASMVWGMGFLAAGSIILGIAPQLAVNTLLNPILRAFSLSAIHVTWFGFSPDTGAFSTTGGLVLAVISLVVGGGIYALAYVARPVAATAGGAAMAGAGGGVFTGGEPLPDGDRLSASDFSSIFQQNWKSFFRWSNVDRVYLAVWDALQTVSRALGGVVGWMERKAPSLVVVFAAAIFAFVRWGVPSPLGAHEGAPLPVSTVLIAPTGMPAARRIASHSS